MKTMFLKYFCIAHETGIEAHPSSLDLGLAREDVGGRSLWL